ncbi:MAG: cobyrinic acid a,c-diamide synthase, partial [Oscillospiraceae bacterium]|nr:cobyrinic acid a,c-diamide synthase [Oscillospiraceae bacterium]
MKRLMLSAMASNSGKTVLTCGLLTALKNRGLEPEAFKCGPDYIDPMIHSRVLGVPCRNLDLFLQGEQGVGRTLAGQRSGIALIEGAMGFYDGLNGTDQASPWQLAALWNIPTVLILRPGGGSLTLAAQLKGLLDFRRPCPIVGVIFTDCKQSLHDYLKPLVERETGLAVLGWLPPMEQARLSSRHLGLIRAEEVTDFQQRFQAVAAQLEQTVDISRLLQ